MGKSLSQFLMPISLSFLAVFFELEEYFMLSVVIIISYVLYMDNVRFYCKQQKLKQ